MDTRIESITHSVSVNSSVNIRPEVQVSSSPSVPSRGSNLWREIEALKAQNSNLASSLEKSEIFKKESPLKEKGKTHWSPPKDGSVLKAGGADCTLAGLREQNSLIKSPDGSMEDQFGVNAHTAHRGLKFRKQETYSIEMKENIPNGDSRTFHSDTFEKEKSTETMVGQNGKYANEAGLTPWRKCTRMKRDGYALNSSPNSNLGDAVMHDPPGQLSSKTPNLEDVMDMNMTQLNNLRVKLGLKAHHKITKALLLKKIITNLKWRKKRSFKKSENVSHWEPPSNLPSPVSNSSNECGGCLESNANAENGISATRAAGGGSIVIRPITKVSPKSNAYSGEKDEKLHQHGLSGRILDQDDAESIGAISMASDKNAPLEDDLGGSSRALGHGRERRLMEEINNLRSVVNSLKNDLHTSEIQRAEMAVKIRKFEFNGSKSHLSDVVILDCTRNLKLKEDNNFGVLWNLSDRFEAFRSIDEHLSNLNHARRKEDEHPMVIMSSSERDTVSYPFHENMKGVVSRARDEICFDSDIIGQVAVNVETEIEITSGYGGVKGNLLWFNSGDSDLNLRFTRDDESRVILIQPGFGVCWGKREKHTRVFLSCALAPEALFRNCDWLKRKARAIFFGSSSGLGCWLNELDAENPSDSYKQHSLGQQRKEIVREWNRRLGMEPFNNRRNSIRIAPMKGSDLQIGALAEKVDCFRDWIVTTLQKAKLSSTPNDINVLPSMEKPMHGDKFEVLWAELTFEDDMWDDQVMWDIRYLLMGSKLGKIHGFPIELEKLRERIFISRDGQSERGRKGLGF